MTKDFAVRGNKLISHYDQFKRLRWVLMDNRWEWTCSNGGIPSL